MPLLNPSTASPSPELADKPIVLHLGDDIAYNHKLYDRLRSQFHIVHPPLSDLQRPTFLSHLRNKTWGDFQAIMRPFWNTGGEMGRWDRELINLLPKGLKVYASAGAGYDWVDADVLAERGIVYCNSRGASTEAVADMALYHIISVFRAMTISSLSARSLDPAQFRDAHTQLPFTSQNPRGHTLGIVGLGDIGFAIAKKVRSTFGMKILYNDVVRKSPEMEREVAATFYPRLEEMLPVSDCVLLATPFTGKKLITASLLTYFKRGSRLVNIARGSLVDETALADALESDHLTAVGMDVHAHEPNVNERLARNWNVTVTSHTGGGALDTVVGFERLAMENVESVLNGREALTPVNAHLIQASHGYDKTNGASTSGRHVESKGGHARNGH